MVASARLGGVDVFHLTNDRDMRARGLAGNHCLYVLELEGRLDARALEARLGRAVSAMPELGWRLAGRVPGMQRWEPSPRRRAASVVVREIGRDVSLFAEVERLLSVRTGGDEPWALDLVRCAQRDAVVFRWFHPLVDARGAERLVAWLGSGGADGPEPPPPEAERFGTSDKLLEGRDRDARIALARAYTAHVMELGRVPTMSLAGASRGKPLGTMRALRVLLSEEETGMFDARVRKRARLAETSVMLLASARVVDRALQARGFAPAQHLCPLPLSLDPKLGARRLLGNHLTMMLFALDRDDLADEARAIAHLAEQQRAIVRQKLDLAMLAGLDLARWLPRWPYRMLLERPFADETSSFVFSNPGALSIERFAGLAVRDAYSVPTTICPPGIQLASTRFRGKLSATIVYLDGVVDQDQAAGMAEDLRAELLL